MNSANWIGVFDHLPKKRLLTVGFALTLVAIAASRSSQIKPTETVRKNPVSAAIDPAISANTPDLVPDMISLTEQQLISLRAQRIRADAARERNDRKSVCFQKIESICIELKLWRVRNQLNRLISQDGSLSTSPERALQLTAETKAMLTALRLSGVVDENTDRLIQVYLPATEGAAVDLSGLADLIERLQSYLDDRKVNRMSNMGLQEEIPQLKEGDNVKKRSTP